MYLFNLSHLLLQLEQGNKWFSLSSPFLRRETNTKQGEQILFLKGILSLSLRATILTGLGELYQFTFLSLYSSEQGEQIHFFKNISSLRGETNTDLSG